MVTKIRKAITVKGDDSKDNLGLVHIYTGDGKGKTTASLGLAMRALGNGYKVYMIQFLKSGFSGELKSANEFKENFSIDQYGSDAIKERNKPQMMLTNGAIVSEDSKFVFRPDEIEKEAARLGLKTAQEIIRSNNFEVVILDEINCVIDKGLISIDEALDLIKTHGKVELVFTGRDAPDKLFEHADYVSVIQKIKHPWQQGIKARKGIEY